VRPQVKPVTTKRAEVSVMKLKDVNKDIEGLLLEMTNDKVMFKVTSLDESIEALVEELPPEVRYVTDFRIMAYAADAEGKKLEEVGFIDCASIITGVHYKGVKNFLTLCGTVSSDLFHMAKAIADEDGNVGKEICPDLCDVMYVKALYVEEKYRGMGIGKYLLDNLGTLISRFMKYPFHTYVLNPYPHTKTGEYDVTRATVDEKRRVVEFFRKSGFRKIEGTEYMYNVKAHELFHSLD
jgi:GNAT superfamily N-acetyltransferase